MKTGFNMIDFDEIFPIQSSEFTKSLYFQSNSKKLQSNYKKKKIHLKFNFYR